jgi:hypothetical protein
MTRLASRLRHGVIALAAMGLSTGAHAADQAPATSSAQGAEAARLAAAAKLVETMHLASQLDAILPQMIEMTMGALTRGNTGKEAQINRILTEEFGRAVDAQKPAFMTLYRDLYARNFSLAEIEGMQAFYATPIGQSVLTKMPELTRDSMQSGMALGQKAAQAAIPEIMKRMQAAQLEVPRGT